MQQVRTHFSTAYELPLLTRAENYAQVSPSPERPAPAPRAPGMGISEEGLAPHRWDSASPVQVCACSPQNVRGRGRFCLPYVPAQAWLGIREGQAWTEREAFSSAMFAPFAVGIRSKAG